jgi:hypothetical protein
LSGVYVLCPECGSHGEINFIETPKSGTYNQIEVHAHCTDSRCPVSDWSSYFFNEHEEIFYSEGREPHLWERNDN